MPEEVKINLALVLVLNTSLDELLDIFLWLIISHAEHCDVGFKFIP